MRCLPPCVRCKLLYDDAKLVCETKRNGILQGETTVRARQACRCRIAALVDSGGQRGWWWR